VRLALLAPLVTPIAEPHKGGSQAFIADLARALAERGHDVDLYAASGSDVGGGVNFVDTGVDAATLSHALYRADGADAAPVDITADAYATVYARVREGGYDVVHNHGFDAPAVRLATGLGAPVVHTMHLPPAGTIVAALHDAARGASPPTIAAVSKASAAAWAAHVAVAGVLPSLVPTARIPWSGAPGAGALFAGRLSPEKGVLEAIRIARAAGLPIDVYGDPYDAAYAGSVARLAATESEVTLHPALPRADLWLRMKAAAVVLCPARWEEPFGLVAAEAQACGTPVVAARRGGLPENVADGITGFLLDTDDVDAWARAAVAATALSRPGCRHHAETNLDLELSIDAHEALYAGLIPSKVRVSA